MKSGKVKEMTIDILVDIIGGLLIAIGVYNFAAASEFPVAGFSGIALLIYHIWGIPMGIMTIILNIPIIFWCYKLLGKTFLLKSLKTMIISTICMDVIAPMFPMYEGDLMLSCICMGLISGLGYGLIYIRDSSTGGADFIIMGVRKLRPHLSLGKIILVMDFTIVIIGGLIMGGNIDLIIYGLIGSYLLSVVVDKVMYGLDSGKLTLVVTDKGYEVAERIDMLTQRGSTLLKAVGSFSKRDKSVVMCACNNKQMHMVHKAVKEIDPRAFLVTMEANQVRGEGFRPH